MRCAACDRSFNNPQLMPKADGMVPGTTIKRWRMLCSDCIGTAVVSTPVEPEPVRGPDEDYFADDPGWL